MTSKEEIERFSEAHVMGGVERLFRQLPASISLLLGLSGLAYVVGWFAARAYLTEFGAEWLLPEMSTATLLGYSWLPILWTTFFAYIGICDLVGTHKEKFDAGKIRRFIRWFILLTVVSSIASYFKTQYQAVLAFLSAIVVVVLAGATIEISVLHFGTPRKTSDTSTLHLAWGILTFAVYLAPTQIGRARALEDLDLKNSKMGIITTANNEGPTLRLLHANGERIYAVELGETPEAREIRILPVTSVISIRKPKGKGT